MPDLAGIAACPTGAKKKWRKNIYREMMHATLRMVIYRRWSYMTIGTTGCPIASRILAARSFKVNWMAYTPLSNTPRQMCIVNVRRSKAASTAFDRLRCRTI
ncbi:MAG: hypothetical protein VR64_07600 [Desulfatitalea sp. BRH_c12]|nr:MAG: hypothetical protein VR64_07600 [Desulfatitalea sp. BRH_c12]